MEILEKVRAISDEIAAELNMKVHKVYFADEDIGKVLHIELSKEGGVDLNSVTEFTKIINPKLDEMEELDYSYSLDVSSPGAERFVDLEELPQLVGEFVEVIYDDKSLLGTLVDVTDVEITIKHFIKGKPTKTKILITDLKSVQLRIKF